MTKPHIQNDKYESTGDTIIHLGLTLHRIRARKTFGIVVAGMLGGFIASESNLQVSGDAWVSGNAQVYGNARVYGDARVYGNAQVSGPKTIITISPIGSEGGCLTAFIQKDGSILFNRGCFSGDVAALRSAIKEKHGEGPIAKEYDLCIQLAEMRLKP